jgi:hypothetical protein
MSSAVFARCDYRLYHVPGLKTKMAFLAQAMARWKAIWIGSTYLA